MAKYDPAEKWLIEHYGDSILRLAGVENIESWKAVQPEIVQPARLPDGLLEVQLKGETETDLFLLELGTYSEPRIEEQIAREMLLVFADRGRVPECVGLVLHPKGTFVPSDEYSVASRLGMSVFRIRWRIIKLWELDAKTLLAAGDVGLIPWVSLTRFEEPPETVFRQCRDAIDNSAPTDLHDRMLVVTHVLASLRYDEDVLNLYFGGEEKMIEFPAIQNLVAKARHNDILRYLRSRFGALPEDVEGGVRAISDMRALDGLFDHMADCETLDEFRQLLAGGNGRSTSTETEPHA